MSIAETTDQPTPSTIPAPANFPVTWENQEDQGMFWTLNRMHTPDPITPMDELFIGYVWQGVSTVAQLYDIPVRTRTRRINTYMYVTILPAAPAEDGREAQSKRSETKLRGVFARIGDLWKLDLFPEVKQYLDDWQRFDLPGASMPALLAHFDETIVRHIRLWEIHFLAVLPKHIAVSMFDDLCRELFGGENSFEAYRLLRGFDNKTLEADRALWSLSRTALASPEAQRTLEETAASDAIAALEESAGGRAFLEQLRAYLKEYGQLSEKPFQLYAPGWIEDPTPVIKNLKDYITQPDRDLEAELLARAVEREELVAQARHRLGGYPQPVVQEFEFLLKAAQEAAVVGEDHNFWIDFCAIYQVRRVLLEFGRRFAEAGGVDKADDVLFLTPDELRETATALPRIDRRRVVAGRRAEVEYFRTIQAPAALGTRPPGPPPESPLRRALGKFFGPPSAPSTEPGVLRGNGGSPGTARGPAKVVRSLAEAVKLQTGDILVAETTSAPWTPLFATAAAIVTDAGGVLSHCAVVAREFGIPAVVGTGQATAVIRDGQLLEVNGDSGVVRVLSEHGS
jgi:pyruvate,water dikinase